ncbi:hypothetical protein H101_07941 [Trichophyton interdigitale H6]|nr:hypothetical protein H101_07941 [Trichophyton interdigitale H6]
MRSKDEYGETQDIHKSITSPSITHILNVEQSGQHGVPVGGQEKVWVEEAPGQCTGVKERDKTICPKTVIMRDLGGVIRASWSLEIPFRAASDRHAKALSLEPLSTDGRLP